MDDYTPLIGALATDRIRQFNLLPDQRTIVRSAVHELALGDVTIGPPPELPYGLHLLSARSGGGKTVHSLALALWAKAFSVPSYYLYAGEPRSSQVIDLIFDADAWSNRLDTVSLTGKGGVIVVDSLTYMVTNLPRVRAMEKTIAAVTYKGGLRPIDVLGILEYDRAAATNGVAMVGTLNTDLFPSVDQLEGACEGAINISSFGVLNVRNRARRVWTNVVIPKIFMDLASRELGYTSVNEQLSNQDTV